MIITMFGSVQSADIKTASLLRIFMSPMKITGMGERMTNGKAS